MYIDVYIDILGWRDQAAQKFFKVQKGTLRENPKCNFGT